ncbi:MAG TPA: hypothetical protein VLH10_11470 [Yinghuangia sp.]|uniref:hypothetical protein n=1 Tax=Yinghuangia sp. YIM S10712 TaxID=3436930 RepID=UPI002CD2514B|nr:hypothetical protein [Yinghuangia sp.]
MTAPALFVPDDSSGTAAVFRGDRTDVPGRFLAALPMPTLLLDCPVTAIATHVLARECKSE